MSLVQQYRNEILHSLDILPVEMVGQLKAFTDFLIFKNQEQEKSLSVEAHLQLQQEALKKIWDHPDEDLYKI